MSSQTMGQFCVGGAACDFINLRNSRANPVAGMSTVRVTGTARARSGQRLRGGSAAHFGSPNCFR